MSFICEKCTFETEIHSEYVAHKAAHVLGKIPLPNSGDEGEPNKPPVVAGSEKAPPPVVKPDTDRKAISLKYIYEGNCTTCGKKVETLEIDVGNDHFCIAFCTACKEQKSQRKVVKL